MANPFPANFEGLDGSRRLTGQVNFTDPANQPGGGGGASPVALLGPFDLTFTDINLALGAAIDLSGPLTVGDLIEPIAFFPTYFDGGAPDNSIDVGIIRPASSIVTGEAVQFDGNAPSDEVASYGVSGLFDPAGRFPRRAVYRIKQAGCALGLLGASTFTRGEIIVWAFVWTP